MARCSRGSTRSASSRRARSRAARRFSRSSSAPRSHCSRSRSSRPRRVSAAARARRRESRYTRSRRTRTRSDALRPLLASQRRLRAGVGRPDGDALPHPGRDLARDPLVPPRARRDARGGSREGRAPRQPRPRAAALVAHGVARRAQRGDLARFWALSWARCSSSSSTHRSRRSTSWPASSMPPRSRSSGSSPPTCTSTRGRGSSSSRSSTSASCRRRSSFRGHRARAPPESPMSFRPPPRLHVENPAREGGRHGRAPGRN